MAPAATRPIPPSPSCRGCSISATRPRRRACGPPPSPTAAHTYTEDFYADAILTITDSNGATDSVEVDINIGTLPVANLDANPTSGSAPLNVTFNTAGTSSSTTFILAFGEGTFLSGSGTPPLTIPHTYQNPGAYVATLEIRVGTLEPFTASDSVVIEVGRPPPVADLTADRTAGAAPLAVVFDGSGSSAMSPVVISSYTLDFGDGTPPMSGSGTPPSSIPHTYTAPGPYTARLTVFGSGCDPPPPVGGAGSALGGGPVVAAEHLPCSDSDSLTITVFDPPTAVLTATPDSGPEPLVVSLGTAGTSAGAGTVISSFTLSFGDGTPPWSVPDRHQPLSSTPTSSPGPTRPRSRSSTPMA